MKKFFVSLGLFFTLTPSLFAQNTLRQQIAKIVKPINGIIGVSVLCIEDRDTVNYNGNARLIMQSVMKFPIALTVLHLVDSGVFSLDKPIHIRKRDLAKNTVSPLREKFPDGDIDVSISDLLTYMVSQSDNTACDVLLKTIGGTQAVQSYLLSRGIRGIAINGTEAEMAADWGVQYTNWCKPVDMVKVLHLFYKDALLSKANTEFLYKRPLPMMWE
jgi:beta-lactamase class A